VNDLDENYVPRGESKDELLQTRLFSFRQGALVPASVVFDSFGAILGLLYSQGIPGFEPIGSIDDLGYFARQRLEFMKRLYSARHGVYRGTVAPLGGKVHVFGVDRGGVIKEYSKIRE
jgi:hypothetical protein